MNPKGGPSCQPTIWREISVCGNVYGLRKTRSTTDKGKTVSSTVLVSDKVELYTNLLNYPWVQTIYFVTEFILQKCYIFFCFTQVEGESNVLLDGSLIDLCGAVLLWRSAEALKEIAVCIFFVF